MRILVPVDGSPYSMEGIKVASEYVHSRGVTTLYLMTVTPYISDMDLEVSASERDLLTESFKRRGEGIIESAKKLTESLGVMNIRTVLTSAASAAEAIVTFAEQEKIDLIVIGSKGMGSTARFFVGSVAAHVVMYSPTCVYVVKEPCRLS